MRGPVCLRLRRRASLECVGVLPAAALTDPLPTAAFEWPAVHADFPAAAAQRPEHRAARDARDGARRGADPTNAAQGCYLSR